eukprot:s139_g7.t1
MSRNGDGFHWELPLAIDDFPADGIVQVLSDQKAATAALMAVNLKSKELRQCEMPAAAHDQPEGSDDLVGAGGLDETLGFGAGKQRLLFRGRDLTANAEDDPQWSSLGVPFGEVIQLVIIMYETGSTNSASAVRKLTFEFSWTAVPTRLRSGKITTHHLNGSCILLDSACNVLGEVDFQATRSSGISHGGPSSIRNPRQLITVDTTLLASTCRYLFFTLSAFKPGGVTLESFQNPSVRLKNAITMQQLASYNASRSGREEAVVLCCAVKDQISGNWRVQETGVRSDGNAKMYGPLHTTVRQLVLGGKV